MDQIERLNKIAKKLRRDIVVSVGTGFPGHIGGSCSAADIVAALYFYKMKHDPNNPEMKERDRFILSKGHAALVQYAALAEAGYFSVKCLNTVKELGSFLQGHPDYRKTPGIEVGTGSLGQGLSVGLGIALGLKADGLDSRVYVMCGDGEMAEGQIWEAAMAAGAYHMDHLTVIIDKNNLQATGRIKDRLNSDPLAAKWEAFGWKVIETDGHDMEQIMLALDETDHFDGRPTAVIAHTVKGKGISFAENVVSFHNGTLTEELYQKALDELDG